MTEKGLVTKLSGKSMCVKMFPLTSCGECKACDAHKRSDMTIEIENTCNASVGDYVSVDMKETILAGAVIFLRYTAYGFYNWYFAWLADYTGLGFRKPAGAGYSRYRGKLFIIKLFVYPPGRSAD